jgi:hypothetical protein
MSSIKYDDMGTEHMIVCNSNSTVRLVRSLKQIQKNVTDTLVAYTQPVVNVKDSGEGI